MVNSPLTHYSVFTGRDHLNNIKHIIKKNKPQLKCWFFSCATRLIITYWEPVSWLLEGEKCTKTPRAAVWWPPCGSGPAGFRLFDCKCFRKVRWFNKSVCESSAMEMSGRELKWTDESLAQWWFAAAALRHWLSEPKRLASFLLLVLLSTIPWSTVTFANLRWGKLNLAPSSLVCCDLYFPCLEHKEINDRNEIPWLQVNIYCAGPSVCVCVWLAGALQRLGPLSVAKWLDVQNKGAIKDLPVPLLCPGRLIGLIWTCERGGNCQKILSFLPLSFKMVLGWLKPRKIFLHWKMTGTSKTVFESWHLIEQWRLLSTWLKYYFTFLEVFKLDAVFPANML